MAARGQLAGRKHPHAVVNSVKRLHGRGRIVEWRGGDAPQRDVHELANPVRRIVVVGAFRLENDALEHFSSLPLIEAAIGDPKERRVGGHRVPYRRYELKTAVRPACNLDESTLIEDVDVAGLG